jgi:hypothetical protein
MRVDKSYNMPKSELIFLLEALTRWFFLKKKRDGSAVSIAMLRISPAMPALAMLFYIAHSGQYG